MSDVDTRLREAFGEARVRRDAPLGPFTTFRVGGPADWVVDLHGSEDLRLAVRIAREAGIPVTVLGGGSNVLVADEGVRGLVIRVHGGQVSAPDAATVRVDAGVTINGLVRWTINRGAAGLEAWAGTPGTVGGAIFGNAHFQGRLISELVETVTLVTEAGEVADVPVGEMEFGYDFSRLHRTGEIAVSADFRVATGEPGALRAIARESLAFRKRTQPLESSSAGCIFQNPDPARDRVPDGIPASAGANFIVNEGGATARDIRTLIERCKSEVLARFGVALREEIVYLPKTKGRG
jgi:UDP-N-acetylmuramate dehydrogenase